MVRLSLAIYLGSGSVFVMLVELFQLLPDPLVLLSHKAVLSSPKAPNIKDDCVKLVEFCHVPV